MPRARSIRFSGFTFTDLGLIVLTIVVLAPSLKVLTQQQEQIATLKAQNSASREAVNNLTSEKARWDDPSYIEAQARSRLNYVFPGELSYQVRDDTGAATSTTTSNGQPISDKIQTTKVDWLSTMLSSVFTAALTDAPESKLVAPVIKGQ